MGEKQQERETIWSFLMLLFDAKPDPPQVDLPDTLAEATDKSLGWFASDWNIVELMGKAGVDIEFYKNRFKSHPLRLAELRNAFDKCTTGAVGQDAGRQVIVHDAHDSSFRDLIAKIVTYSHNFDRNRVDMHESIDDAIRLVVGMPGRERS